jgi:hypothetical protein
VVKKTHNFYESVFLGMVIASVGWALVLGNGGIDSMGSMTGSTVLDKGCYNKAYDLQAKVNRTVLGAAELGESVAVRSDYANLCSESNGASYAYNTPKRDKQGNVKPEGVRYIEFLSGDKLYEQYHYNNDGAVKEQKQAYFCADGKIYFKGDLCSS